VTLVSSTRDRSEASYDPERNSFASEQSYDPERSSFASEKYSSGSALPGNQLKENSFASEKSYDPERNSRATLASEQSYDPERSSGPASKHSSFPASEQSYDPERSGFGAPALITAQTSYDPEVLQFTCFTSGKKYKYSRSRGAAAELHDVQHLLRS
jgi:hypothetical protein